MRNLLAFAVVVFLGLPCVAQAYFFEITEASGSYGDYWTHPDQADFNIDRLTNDYYTDKGLEGTFVLYSDAGRDVVTDVDVRLTLDYNANYIEDGLSWGTRSSFSTNIQTSSGSTVHSESGSDMDFAWSKHLTDTFQLTTGVEYSFAFLTSFTDFDGWSISNLDVFMVVLSDEYSPTPVPGAVWLLGTGLVGLVGLRRKRA